MLEARAAQVEQLIEEGEPTIPVTIGDEKLANPFLRADVADLAVDIGMAGKPAAEVFAEIRGTQGQVLIARNRVALLGWIADNAVSSCSEDHNADMPDDQAPAGH